jgi:hypothetical protein
MNAIEIIAAVREHGAHVSVERDQLVVRGAGSSLPAEIRAELAAHKMEVMIALGEPIDRTVGGILSDIRPHLSPALRQIPDDRLLVLVNWSIITAFDKAIRTATSR